MQPSPYPTSYLETIRNWFRIFYQPEKVIQAEVFNIFYQKAFINIALAILIYTLSFITVSLSMFFMGFLSNFIMVTLSLFILLGLTHLIANRISKEKKQFKELFYYASLVTAGGFVILIILNLIINLASLALPVLRSLNFPAFLIVIIYSIYIMIRITSITYQLKTSRAVAAFLPSILIIALLIGAMGFLIFYIQTKMPELQQLEDCISEHQNTNFCLTIHPPYGKAKDYCHTAPEKEKEPCYQLLLNQTAFLKENNFCEQLLDEEMKAECLKLTFLP